jgi:hypothetical protein
LLEATLQTVLWSTLAYFGVGLPLLLPIHLRGLPNIDPACRKTGVGFRLLISPGIVSFWPLLLIRWRHANRSDTSPDARDRGANLTRWHLAAIGLFLVIGPLTAVLALPHRSVPAAENSFPRRARVFPEWIQRGATVGRVFPSIPATVRLGRDIGRRPGLRFQFDEDASIPPTALYWSPDLGEDGNLPKAAIFLGMISGAEIPWVRFSREEMVTTGFWISYSFTDHSMDIYPVSSSRS